MRGMYKKETSHEIAQDDVRMRNIYCESAKHIKWCKKYLSRYYRHKSNSQRFDFLHFILTLSQNQTKKVSFMTITVKDQNEDNLTKFAGEEKGDPLQKLDIGRDAIVDAIIELLEKLR